MKLTVFQSDKGDCLLVESVDGKTVLTDGGMANTFSKHVAPFLGEMQDKGENVDVIYVSHIDEDHISGILQMMDDAVEWRIYDYQTTVGGNPNFKKPEVLRPPQVDRVWHNAFHEQVDDNTGEIEDMLAATVAVLAGGKDQKYLRMAEFHQDVATSINQAINLSRKLGEKHLNIKLNPEAEGKLMMLREQPNGKYNSPIKIGKMKWTLIGPSKTDLEKLKEDWNKWLKKSRKTLAHIDENARRTERRLGNSLANEVGQIVNIANKQAELLAYNLLDQLDMSAEKVLGVRQKVTVPNLASLMFLAEEKNAQGKTKTILLTGDGHHEDILKGLELQKKIKPNETLFVDVLKIPHHGSEHNSNREFYKKIIADHYVFCGNGAHKNPDLDIMEAVLDSRLNAEYQGNHPKMNQKFKLWFNSFPKNPDAKDEDNKHLQKVENLVKKYHSDNGEKFEYFFLEDSFFEVNL